MRLTKVLRTLAFGSLSALALAQGESIADLAYALDTIALLMCAVLVIHMKPGFALLEAGLHGSKNAVNIFMKNYATFAIAGLAFWAIGFSIMYGSGLFLSGYEADLFPGAADFFFQMVFAATAATIVSGAIGGRMKFGAYLVFALVMTAFIYPFLGSWHWGEGWLYRLGFYDFAGSSVVHAVGGFAALGGIMALGPRLGRYVNGKVMAMPGHNLPLAGVGVFLLWIGWFGFNGGSQLAFSTVEDAQAIATVFLNTNLAAAAGAFAALALSWAIFKKPDFSMTLNGVIAGLVSITAGPDVINGIWAVLVGAIGGVVVTYSILLLDRLKLDDPVGAVSAHGTVGVWGTVAVGIFGGANLGVQLLGTLAYAGAAFGLTFVLFLALKAVMGIRVHAQEEVTGLDVAEHGAEAYRNHDSLNDPVLVGAGD
ncbi:MAG: ammonium transporter [Trueperaceae bacterium]|nr:MAG: ammonium transporter [Trueperaceae bacterium]